MSIWWVLFQIRPQQTMCLVPVNNSLWHCLLLFIFPALHLHSLFLDSNITALFKEFPFQWTLISHVAPFASLLHTISSFSLSLASPPITVSVLIPSLPGMWLPWQLLTHPPPPAAVLQIHLLMQQGRHHPGCIRLLIYLTPRVALLVAAVCAGWSQGAKRDSRLNSSLPDG